MISATISNGDDRNAPIGPHSQVQNASAMNTAQRSSSASRATDDHGRQEMTFEEGHGRKQRRRQQSGADGRERDEADHMTRTARTSPPGR